jgi:hypothetical protein
LKPGITLTQSNIRKGADKSLAFPVSYLQYKQKIFGPRRDEVTGNWRKLRNEELHNLYSSPNIIRMIRSGRMRWEEHVARMGETRNGYSILVGKPEKKRPLGRPRRRWVDNIKLDLRGRMGWTGSNWFRIGISGGLL